MIKMTRSRAKLVKAAKQLTSKNIEEVKYLLKDKIGYGVLENIKNATDLFNELEQQDIFTINDLNGLIEIMEDIERNDIAQLLRGTESVSEVKKVIIPSKSQHIPKGKPHSPQQSIDTEVLNDVANLIVGDWKRLARRLKIQEHQIESIDLDCRSIYEKSMKALNTWIKMTAQSVTWADLKTMLEKIPRHDIIRHIENKYDELVKVPEVDVGESGRFYTDTGEEQDEKLQVVELPDENVRPYQDASDFNEKSEISDTYALPTTEYGKTTKQLAKLNINR